MAAAPRDATPTARQQRDLETRIASIYRDLADLDADGHVRRVHTGDDALVLQRDRHARYAAAGAGRLPLAFASLDASRPWICYWVLHSLALLNAPLPDGLAPDDVVAFLSACKAEGGGYGGGPGQMAHLAPTYAALCALMTLGGEAAYESVDRAAVAAFLRRMAVAPERGGGFTMHAGGEADARACYTAMVLATTLNLDVEGLAAASGVVEYLARCQTNEGGLGGAPGNEAHGGYTYCGAAALALLGRLDALDLPRLARWVAQRQGGVEGGFNGRTNKLVDGCYSFWQGAVLPLLLREGGGLLSRQALAGGTPLAGDLDLVAPELPSFAGVCTPYEEACKESERLNDRAELLVERALEAEKVVLDLKQKQQKQPEAKRDAAAEAAGGGGAAEPPLLAAELEEAERKARWLLQEGEEAQRASEDADLVMEIAQYSAVQLFVCFDGEGARPRPDHIDGGGGPDRTAGGAGGGDPAGAAATTTSGAPEQQQQQPGGSKPVNPMFDWDALQVWVLKGCQLPLKGGLRDKPGKPPDYYHTCYCLSGLSVAQHVAGGGGVLGAAGNELKKTDLLVNVVEARAEEARAWFAARPQLLCPPPE